MAVTSKMYLHGMVGILDGTISWTTHSFKVALLTDAYTPDIDTHEHFDDLTNEITGDGYVAGGTALSGMSKSLNTASDERIYDATDVTWDYVDDVFRYAVVYSTQGGSAATNDLLVYFDFGENIDVPGNIFRLVWSFDGVFKFKVA